MEACSLNISQWNTNRLLSIQKVKQDHNSLVT
jgi:hypothetical protein